MVDGCGSKWLMDVVGYGWRLGWGIRREYLIRTVTIRSFVTFVTDDFKRGSVRFDATDAQNIGECILF